MQFDLTDLQLFANVVDAGSITGGAGRSHIALASASARIRGMERTLGVALLVRARRGVSVTPAGHTLLYHAQTVLQQVARMRDELGEYARGMRGHIRLLCNTAAMTEFLPQALRAYMTDHAGVDIDLEERPSFEIVQAVGKGTADVGIVADAIDTAGLEIFPFRRDRMVLVVARDHPLLAGATVDGPAGASTGCRAIDFAEALDYDFVGLAGDSALQKYLSQHAALAGKSFRYRVRLRSFEAICRMVESGVGVGIVPVTAARRCARSMRIAQLALNNAWADRTLNICVRHYAELPSHTRQLIDSIRLCDSHASRGPTR